MGKLINNIISTKMFAKLALLSFASYVSAQAEDADGLTNCRTDLDCNETSEGAMEKCATLTMEDYSADMCVAQLLCGEDIDIEGVTMRYRCKTGAKQLIASMAALLAIGYAM